MKKRLAVALLLSTTLAGCSYDAPGQAAGRSLAQPAGTGTSASAPSSGGTAACTYTSIPATSAVKDVGKPPARARAAGKAVMTITTNVGVIEVALDPAGAPCTVASFDYLAGKHFFDNTPCHRLTAAETLAVLQCGDPSGTGTGGPAYQFAEENLASVGPSTGGYKRGLVAMARTQDPGTNGSQFFMMIKDGQLNPDYTPFGTITRGLEVLDQIAAAGITPSGINGDADGAPKNQVKLQRVTVAYS
ncbi:peptidylprolyl isomerase [Dactylosporangium sp. NPDC049525]|uniref:peptidylprolyl isomerase n=1 Tax=Dactylosporangium sp. NPDC049525 TaxID=3154730 RepID=UPI003426F31C